MDNQTPPLDWTTTELEYLDRGRVIGSELFVSAEVAIAMIQSAAPRGEEILGVDVFRLEHDVAYPLLTEEPDYNDTSNPRHLDGLVDFLERYRGSSRWFVVVLDKSHQ